MQPSWIRLLRGRVVLAGIGNPLRGDDAAGPRLIERLQGRVRAACVDAGPAPENYAGRITREDPDTIVLVDAVHLNQAPGAYALLEPLDILKGGLSTHDLSPRLLIDYLRRHSRARIYLLGIQPQNLSLGADLSEPVQRAVDELATCLGAALCP